MMNPNVIIAANQERFDDPPPAYSSLDTTRFPSPDTVSPTEASRQFDAVAQLRLQVEARSSGKSGYLFNTLTRQEKERVIHQISGRLTGRRQTLVLDQRLDLWANAENNIREFWMRENIWEDEWGLAWPPDSSPMDNLWRWTKSAGISHPQPNGPWRHERAAKYASKCSEAKAVERARKPSRPCQQLMSQVARDMWQPSWDEYPGLEWAHERPDDILENDPLYKQLYAPPQSVIDPVETEYEIADGLIFGSRVAKQSAAGKQANASTSGTLRRNDQLNHPVDVVTKTDSPRPEYRISGECISKHSAARVQFDASPIRTSRRNEHPTPLRRSPRLKREADPSSHPEGIKLEQSTRLRRSSRLKEKAERLTRPDKVRKPQRNQEQKRKTGRKKR
nr:hypothetical protein CFP56_13098 [Quercus suber]